MASVGNALKAFVGQLISVAPPWLQKAVEQVLGPMVPIEPLADVIASNFRVDVLRTDDLLVLRLDFHNVSLVADPSVAGGRKLVRTAPAEALVGVTLPPQSFGEHAFTDTVGEPPVEARLAGSSQLVLRVPKTELLKTPYTVAHILILLRRCEPVVTDRKEQPLGFESDKGPVLDRRFTAVEAPYRLYLSPQPKTRWAHSSDPVTDMSTGRTELWHTRLGRAGSKPGQVVETGDPPKVHAVWTDGGKDPLSTALSANERQQIVDLSSNSDADPTLRPITAEQMMLSALGAWLQVDANFATDDEESPNLSLVGWRHRMTMGRDQFVRTVKAGNIYPFGHRAALIKITERMPLPLPHDPSHHGAYLMQRWYVSIREPEKTYAYPGMPLERVRIAPLLTPEIRPIAVGSDGMNAIRIVVADGADAGSDFLFRVNGTDLEGRSVDFETPLFWVSRDFDMKFLGGVKNAYRSIPPRDVRGQKVAFAPSEKRGETSLDTSSLTFTGDRPSEPVPGIPFLPSVQEARVRIEAVETLTGQLTESRVAYLPKFLHGEFNPSELYMVVKSPFGTAMTPQQSGGLAAPNFEVRVLSRFAGPLPVAADASGASLFDGKFRPTAILPSIKLLGGIDLGQIFLDREINRAVGAEIPNLTTTRTGNTIETRYEWTTTHLHDCRIFTPGGSAEFSLVSSFKQELDPATGAPGASTQEIRGSLKDFAILLLPDPTAKSGEEPKLPTLVGLCFDSVVFTSVPSKKVDVAVTLKDPALEFFGPLKLVNAVLEHIPLDGFSDPPSLDVTTDGVSLGYSLAIPTIGIGVFTLANISFSAGFYLPFVDSPLGVRLAFCERPQPFTLTVYGLGGGGFFGITFGLGGVETIEMALEFGAALAINLGVASGSVSVMGGVYYQKSGAGFMLEAYIRMNGTLRVLGLISVSCVFYLSLTYIAADDVLKGQASLSIRVKVVFFSKTVSVTVERTLKGKDPTFREVFTEHEDRVLDAVVDDWADYAGAFAAYA